MKRTRSAPLGKTDSRDLRRVQQQAQRASCWRHFSRRRFEPNRSGPSVTCFWTQRDRGKRKWAQRVLRKRSPGLFMKALVQSERLGQRLFMVEEHRRRRGAPRRRLGQSVLLDGDKGWRVVRRGDRSGRLRGGPCAGSAILRGLSRQGWARALSLPRRSAAVPGRLPLWSALEARSWVAGFGT